MSIDSPEILAAAKKAVEQFNTDSKAKKFFKLIEVSSAQTQVRSVFIQALNRPPSWGRWPNALDSKGYTRIFTVRLHSGI